MGSQTSTQNHGPELFTRSHEVRIKRVFKIQDDPESRVPTPEPEIRPIHVKPTVYVQPPTHRVIMVQNKHALNTIMSPIYSPQPQQFYTNRRVPIYQNSLTTIKVGHFFN